MHRPTAEPPWRERIIQAIGWTIFGSVVTVALLVGVLAVTALSLLAATGAFAPWPLFVYGVIGGLLIALVLVTLAVDAGTGCLSGLILVGPWALVAIVLLGVGADRPEVRDLLGLGFGLSLAGVLVGVLVVAVRINRSNDKGTGEG